MTKNEIIEAVAFAIIPEGAVLIERDVGHGVSVGRSGNNQQGLEMMLARMYCDLFQQQFDYLLDEPTPYLFASLHSHLIASRASQIACNRGLEFSLYPEAQVIEGFGKMITRLRGFAQELGIAYDEPVDPLGQ